MKVSSLDIKRSNKNILLVYVVLLKLNYKGSFINTKVDLGSRKKLICKLIVLKFT